MFYYSLKIYISPQKQTKKVFKSATDYNFKATELNEQEKGFFFYIYLIFISLLLDFDF